MPNVTVQPPNQEDRNRNYEKEAEQLKTLFGETLQTVHHIGSTAVPNIYARPTVDLIAVVDDIENVDHLHNQLQELGYTLQKDPQHPEELRLYAKDHDYLIYFHEKGHREIMKHLLFRDYLKQHDHDAQAFSLLKQKLADEHRDDMTTYNDKKQEVMTAIQKRALLWFKRSFKQ